MATDRRRRAGTVAAVALAAIGLLLVALPWLERPGCNPLPPTFAAGSAAHYQLLGCVRAADDCCRRGDLDGFLAATTPGYIADLERQLRPLGRRLERSTLLDAVAGERRAGLLGQLQQLQFVSGSSRGMTALLVYDYPSPSPQPVFDGCKVVRCRWDGHRFRLDLARDVRRLPGQDRQQQLAALDALMQD